MAKSFASLFCILSPAQVAMMTMKNAVVLVAAKAPSLQTADLLFQIVWLGMGQSLLYVMVNVVVLKSRCLRPLHFRKAQK